ncbi:MAG: RimK family alpha-L-glutamate ligase [Clostridia bacterium]
MKGLLVVNSFIKTTAFDELYSSLERAFFERNVALTIKGNAEVLAHIGFDAGTREKYDFVLFWDKDILLAYHLENLGCTLYNSAAAIENADDKGRTAIILNKAKIPMPPTILTPLTYPAVGYGDDNFINTVIRTLGFPLILKKNKGSFGLDVYLIASRQELIGKLKEFAGENMLFQEYLSGARDIRIYVAGGKAIAAAERLPQNGDFRANFALGGKMRSYNPSTQELTLAIDAANALGLSFAGVDILLPKGGEPLVLEVNSNAHFKGLSEVSGKDIAGSIAEHIIEDVKTRKKL